LLTPEVIIKDDHASDPHQLMGQHGIREHIRRLMRSIDVNEIKPSTPPLSDQLRQSKA